jgi:hypothetical protein
MSTPSPIGRLQRLGGLVGAATLASLGAALPGTVRAAAAGDGLLASWALLAGAWMIPALVLVPVFRAARRGVRGLSGDGGREHVAAAAAWLGAMTLALARFGAVLRATTHHHALAGVTFAIGGVVLAVVLALFAARAASWAVRARDGGRGSVGLAVLVAVACLEALVIVRGVPASLAAGARAVAVDGAVAVLSLTVATASWTESRRAIALLGPPLGVACLVVALLSRQADWVDHAPLVGALARGISALR